jgi:hypothetical protein
VLDLQTITSDSCVAPDLPAHGNGPSPPKPDSP